MYLTESLQKLPAPTGVTKLTRDLDISVVHTHTALMPLSDQNCCNKGKVAQTPRRTAQNAGVSLAE